MAQYEFRKEYQFEALDDVEARKIIKTLASNPTLIDSQIRLRRLCDRKPKVVQIDNTEHIQVTLKV